MSFHPVFLLVVSLISTFEKTISVSSQADFDALSQRIHAALSDSPERLRVVFDSGTYRFHDDHISLSMKTALKRSCLWKDRMSALSEAHRASKVHRSSGFRGLWKSLMLTRNCAGSRPDGVFWAVDNCLYRLRPGISCSPDQWSSRRMITCILR